MRLKNKNILLISPDPWDHIFVSKHHYSVYLAKRGNRVFFLNPPSSKMAVQPTQYADVYSVDYTGFLKGFRFFPANIRRYFVRRAFEALENHCSARFDIVWSFDNSLFFDFDALPSYTVKISHIVDLNQDFQTTRAASTANYCFCTTELLKDRLTKFNSKVAKINHGFHMSASGKNHHDKLPGRALALYSGNLSMPYIDWILLKEIVTLNANVDFVFLGPGKDTFTGDSIMRQAKMRVAQSPNVRFIGRVEADLLQSYYQRADLLVIAYQEAFHSEQANPHKMMEYLASGKMIVASYTSEYTELLKKGVILMSERNCDFPDCFRKALKALSYWNGPDLQEARRNFASQNTYEKQIERIEQIIALA